MKTRASSLTLLAILVFFFPALESTVLFGQSRILGTNDLANQSDVVAVGRVAAIRAEWNADKSRILTRVTLSVSEFLKGGDEQAISILTPGGEIGEVGELYFGAPRFAQDEEVVVFVKRGPNRAYTVTGGAQGKAGILLSSSVRGARDRPSSARRSAPHRPKRRALRSRILPVSCYHQQRRIQAAYHASLDPGNGLSSQRRRNRP